MLYTIVGDPHAKPDNLDKIHTLFNMLEDLGNPVIILGDLLDTKEIIRGRCLNTYYERFQNSKLHFSVIVGNHDYFNLTCKEHALEIFKILPNVKVIDIPITIENITLFPFYSDLDALKKLLKKTTTPFVMGHFDTIGFDYGTGRIAEKGLTLKDFSKFKQVISGHYHKSAQVKNLCYLGSPFSHSFGESNQDKFIGVFNTENGELKLLSTPFPRHTTTEVDCDSEISVELVPDDYNRVILNGSEDSINKFPRFEGVKYISMPTTLAKAAVIDETQTPEVMFVNWAEKIKQLDTDVISLGLEVLENVQKD